MAILWESTFDGPAGTKIREIGAPFWSSSSQDMYEWETDGNGSLANDTGQTNAYTVYRVASSPDQKVTLHLEIDHTNNKPPQIALRSTASAQGNGYFLDYDGANWDVAWGWSDKITVPDPTLLTIGEKRKIEFSIEGSSLSLKVSDGNDVLIGEQTVAESSRSTAESIYITLGGAYSATDYSTSALYNHIKIEDFSAEPSGVLPSASFSTDSERVNPGAAVTFTDMSTGSPTSWTWDFGDGATSTEQNPSHIYAVSGDFTVSLTVGNTAGPSAASLLVKARNDWAVSGTQTKDTLTNNYCTWNSMLHSFYDDHVDHSYVFGNMKVTNTSDSDLAMGTMWPTSGKWYWEYGNMNTHTGNMLLGLAGGITYRAQDGTIRVHQNFGGDNTTHPYGEAYTTGDTIGVALDCDSLEIEFFKNNVSQGVVGFTVLGPCSPYTTLDPNNGGQCTLYTGSIGFNYSVPSGYRELCAKNLPSPAIRNSSSVADVVLREGVGEKNKAEGGTASAIHCYTSNFQPSYALDGTLGAPQENAWLAANKEADAWWQVACTTSFIPARYAIGACETVYDLTGWELHGLDGSTWDVLDTQSNQSIPQNTYAYYDIPNVTKSYNTYRVVCKTGSSTYFAIGEFKIWDAEGIAPTKINLGFSPDWVNTKARDTTHRWAMHDTVRGDYKTLATDQTTAETTQLEGISFGASGYNIGTYTGVNQNGINFLDLALKAGPMQGFDIVKYTGNGVAGKQIAHNLGKAPTFMLVKSLESTWNWQVYHVALGPTHSCQLNLADAAAQRVSAWNDTAPTSTHITVGNMAGVNELNKQHIAYLFSDSDIIKAFSYTGNANTNGPYVHLGGKPLAIPFLKNSDASGADGDWTNVDVTRTPYNKADIFLSPNNAETEGTYELLDFTSNGMKLKAAGTNINGSNNLIVGLAILESTKHSNAF